MERQSAGETCCAHARTDGCRNACTDIFRSHLTPTRHQRNLVVDQCEFSSPKVLNCVKNFTKVTPVTNLHKRKLIYKDPILYLNLLKQSVSDLHCCDKSNKSKCREACKNSLSTKTTMQEIIDGLQLGGCGPPLLQVGHHTNEGVIKP